MEARRRTALDLVRWPLRVASKALHQALLRGPVSLRNLGNLVASGSDQEQRETKVSLRYLPSFGKA